MNLDNLTINQKVALVEASSVWGLLRGLETFSQLIYINDQNSVRSPWQMLNEARFSSPGGDQQFGEHCG
jgi:hypothetical protein